MKKYIIIILLIIFITPTIAFASWWNPLSWKIFDFISKKEIPTQKIIKPEQSDIQTINTQLKKGDFKKSNNMVLCERDPICNDYFNASNKEKLFYKTIEEVFSAISKEAKAKSKNFQYVKINVNGENTFLLAQDTKNFPDELVLVYIFTGKISFAPRLE